MLIRTFWKSCSCTLRWQVACVRPHCFVLVCLVHCTFCVSFCVVLINNAEFLPGKRALAVGLSLYHVTCSTVLFNAPRFIPHSFGPLAESYVSSSLQIASHSWLTCPHAFCSIVSRQHQNTYGVCSMGFSASASVFGGRPLSKLLPLCATKCSSPSNLSTV